LFTEKLDLGYSSFVRNESDLEEMKKSLEEEPRIPRFRFDFVIGNPPYVSYNECAGQGLLFFDLIKEKKIRLNDVYGMNLHSVPKHSKKYRPNPNLYAFFIALGLALLKDSGKLCYIIPQTILTAGDLDVLRYHLSKFTTLEKIITFSGKMFMGRGIKQNKPVATSSLILVLNCNAPGELHQVEIIHYKDPDDDIAVCLENILRGKKIIKKAVLQSKLRQNIANWNFITKDKKIIDLLDKYKSCSKDIEIYYNHILAKQSLKSQFFFDSGYSIDDKKILQSPPDRDFYFYPKLNSKYWTIKGNRGFWPNDRSPKSNYFIKLRQANQGYSLLDSTYKIIWSYANPKRFYFTNKQVIWPRNQICAIGSEDKLELYYLLALLNSTLNSTILINLLKSENEKNLQISTSSIKEFVRVPKINRFNKNIKEEIIICTGQLLQLEDYKLSDLVDFSKVMVQKFDDCVVEKKNLVLIKDDKRIELRIEANFKLVQRMISNITGNGLFADSDKISLSTLKNLIALDYAKQEALKNYIDDLVFALYFNVKLSGIGFKKVDRIKAVCEKNEFYKISNNKTLGETKY